MIKHANRLIVLTLMFGFVFIMFSAFDTVSADSSVIYVNDSGGNDDWDGQYAEWISGLSGPKKSIKNATGTVTTGGTINIADGNYIGENNTNIIIDRNMTIKGQSRDNTIINGTDSAQIFQIQDGVKVTIANLTLANGTAIDGGAINNGGILTVINCTFAGNNASNGGAIDNWGSIDVSDSVFTDNNAANGGAIYNYFGTVTVEKSTFTGNNADQGGAINNFYGNLDVKKSNFTDNTVTDGGAIYNYFGTVTVEKSTFTGNNADQGGAIINWGSLNINNSTFTGNSATDGGAIYNYQGTLTIASSTFTGNNASNGGAIYNKGTLNVNGSTFNSNTAINDGGAIFDNYGNSVISSSTFMNNSADQGGAISNYFGGLTVNFSRIVGNTPQDIYYNYSGGIPLDAKYNWWGSNEDPSGRVSGSVDVSKWMVLSITSPKTQIPTSTTSTITVDLTHDNDGVYHDPASGHLPDGISVTLNGTLGTISNVSIVNGTATTTYNAGPKQGVAVISATMDLQTVNTTINVNKVDVYVSPAGDDVNGDGSQSNPFKTIAASIAAVYAGGTVHIANGVYSGENNANIIIDRNMIITGYSRESTIINGNAAQIFVIQKGLNVIIQNLTLSNGKADYGGAIYSNDWANLTVKYCTFTGNSANYDGGAIYDYHGTLNLINTIFNSNSANRYGGAIYNYQSTITVTGGNFIANTAIYAAGAIYNYYWSTLNITSSTFKNNVVNNTPVTNGANSADGGAILNEATLNVDNCNFIGNKAGSGGAIYNSADPAITPIILNVTNCAFNSNTAYWGGAILNGGPMIGGGVLIVDNSTFSGNSAGSGGAIYNFAASGVNNSTFTGNSAIGSGGAITNDGYGGLGVYGSTFEGNNATNSGGAIASNYYGSLTVNFCRIIGNTAPRYGTDIQSGALDNIDYNWWGSNAGPSAGRIYGATVNSWLVLTLNANPTIIKVNSLSNITADLLHDNHGNYHDPALYHVPDGITVNFDTNLGTVGSPISLVNGTVQSALNCGSTDGTASLSAAVDGQTVNTLVIVDAIPPAVSSVDPLNAAEIKIVNKKIIITFSEPIQAGSAYDGILVTGPSGTVLMTKSVSGNVLTLTPTSNYVEGIYSIDIPAGAVTDIVGNDLAAAFDSTFIVDTTAPTVNSNDPLNNAKINVRDKVITITFSEPIQAGSAYDSILVTGPSGTVLMTKSINGNVLTLTPISNYVDGSYSVNIPVSAITDLAGNDLVLEFTSGFIVDATKPTVSANSTGGLFNTSQSIHLIANDNLDPSPVIHYTTDGTNWYTFTGSGTVLISKEGTTNLEFYAVDASGNPSAHIIYSYAIDKTVPVVTADKTGGISNSSISVVLSSESDATIYYRLNNGSWNTFTGSGTVSMSNVGTTNLEFYAVDMAGNPSAHTTYTYTIDKTAPVVTSNKTGGISNSSISVVLSSESDATIYYRLNNGSWSTFTGSGTVSMSNVGTTNLEFYAVDTAGNPSAHTTYNYTIDKTAPVVTATPTSGLSKSISVTLSSESNAKIYYRLNGGSWHTFAGTGKVSITSSGINKLEFYAVDAAGNPSAHKTYTYTIDKTSPKVSATSPKNNAAGVSRTATISIRLSENILKSVNWSKVYIKNLKTGSKCKATIKISGNHIYITTSKKAAYTSYQVYIPASAVKDSAGNNLAASYSFKFKTGKY